MKSKLSSKKSSGWLALLIISLAIVLSCKKQLLFEEQPERQARERMVQWYEANLKVSDGNPFSRLEPNWENVYVSRHGSKNVYEIGLANGEELLVSTDGEQRSLAELSRSSEIRLLIFEDVASGEILYAGYESIQAALPQSLSKLHYRNTGNFNGTILFYHFTGNLSNGWSYVNGRITERINVITEQQFNQAQRQAQGDIKVEATVCKSGYADKYKWQCVGVPGYESCGFNYVGKEYVSYCYWVDNEEAIDHIAPDDHGGYIPPVYVDCAGVAGGTATWSAACNTCIGGTTGLTGCPNLIKEIKVDSTARPCVDTIATAVISKAAEIQNVLSSLLSLANVNASAAIGTMANSSTYKIKIGEHLFIDQTKYNPDGSSYLIRKNGVTNDTTGFIYLNKLMLNDGTDLAVAATIIHELMHSYMVYGIHHTAGTEREVFKTMNTFLFDQSGNPYSNQGLPQHIQMASTYVNSMAALLTSYATSRGILTSPDSSISLSEYCKDIFWQNLQHSQAFIAAPNKSRSASNGEREYKNMYNSTKKKRC